MKKQINKKIKIKMILMMKKEMTCFYLAFKKN